MTRVRYGVARHKKHKRVLKKAKGYWGGRHALYRTAKEAIVRAEVFSTVGRRKKKRDFRELWIVRISAACARHGISYSRFVSGLRRAKVDLNRKMLSELAIHNPAGFESLVTLARSAS
ncbi:MAG: 50S ribosomal protein L20 [Planctomycetes bacterium]|nr:50S ribosomal protein L20 [Planctomycetota bacterium]